MHLMLLNADVQSEPLIKHSLKLCRNIPTCVITASSTATDFADVKDAFTPDTCSRIQVLSSVLLADTSGYNLYPGYMCQV